jgi:phosphoribosylamine--glycine ligase / phosphoribosylformylglycinamidine cyclo-ligase
VLIGLRSSGLHSNGFSLARKIVTRSGLTYASSCPWEEQTTVGRAMLTPTRIYIQQLVPLVRRGGLIKAMSHITGGGFIENLPRMLPKGLGCFVDAKTWALPPVFAWMKQAGNVEALEMARTFNCGIGMVIVVSAEIATEVEHLLREKGEKPVRIGEVTTKPGVEMRSLESWP